MVRRRGSGILTVGLVVTGCAGGSGMQEDLPAAGACAAVEGPLTDGATLAGRGGVYELELVSSDGTRRASGTLSLADRSAPFARGVSTPLDGVAEIDLQGVGAQAVTDLDSRDPSAPGVLVLERGDDGDRAITVRFGSVANRTTDQAIDGAYTVLDVTRIGDAGFFGAWRSGVRMERADGYFCAWPRAD